MQLTRTSKDYLNVSCKESSTGRIPHSRSRLSPLTRKIKLLKLIRAARQDPMTAQMKIAAVLNKELNRSFTLTERWIDSLSRIGGHYDLNKTFYVTVRADVGGFDVGTKVTVQAYGGLGFHITRSIYSNWASATCTTINDSGGFLYKTSTYGPQITMASHSRHFVRQLHSPLIRNEIIGTTFTFELHLQLDEKVTLRNELTHEESIPLHKQ